MTEKNSDLAKEFRFFFLYVRLPKFFLHVVAVAGFWLLYQRYGRVNDAVDGI